MAVPHIAHTWNNNDVITATLLNALETDLAAAGITTVTVNMVAAGTPATGSFTGGVLTLNVPAMNSGSTVSDATSTVKGILQLAGDLTGTAANPQLATVGTAGTFGAAGQSLQITTDSKGRITATATNPITAATVGLGNVNNTSDANKPISTAQAAVNAVKADLVAGVIPTSQIPSLALETVVPVANRAAMLALTTTQVQPGDVAVDTSNSNTRGSYMLTATDPSVIGSWVLLNAPLDVVQSVNGQQGTVVLAAADVGAAPAAVGAANTTAINARALPLIPQATLTAATTPTIGTIQPYNATAGALSPILPALSTVTDNTGYLIVEKDSLDTSLNPVTITCAGTDTFASGATTVPLVMSGERIEIQAATINSVRTWKVKHHTTPRAATDRRYAPSAPSRMPTFDQPPGSLLLEAAPPASAIVILTGDDFSGTANATLAGRSSTLGNASTWTVRSGTWQIDGAGGVAPTAATDGYIATLPIDSYYRNSGTAQVTTSYKGANGGAANSPGLIIRFVDTSNYWVFAPAPASSTFVLYQVKAGTTRVMATIATPAGIVDGTTITLRVDWLGRDMTCYVNNIELYCFVSPDVGMNSGVVGLRQGIAGGYATPVKFSNLRITNHVGPKWNFPRVDAAPGILIGQPGASGTWDNADINNPNVVWDVNAQQWTIYYSGYDGTNGQGLGLLSAPTIQGPWTKDSGNPVVPASTSNAENGGLVWVYGRWLRAEAVGSGLSFFTSPDLRTWTALATTGLPSTMYDAFLRVTLTGQLELWFGNGYPSAQIYRATSVDGGSTWTRPAVVLGKPPYFSWNNYRGNGEPAVFSVPGTADREMIVFADGGEIDGKGYIVAAFTTDSGATWHWRNVAGGSGFGFDSYQKFDAYPIYAEGAFHLFYGASAVNGNSLNIGIGLGRMSVQWSPNPSAASTASLPYGLLDPATAAPTSTAAPVITGIGNVGIPLTATTGTWTPTPDSYTYQWNRAGLGIANATAATYTPTAADVGKAVTVTVVAFKTGYASTPATSNSITIGTITNTAVPTISGTLTVGSTLTATTGTWTPTPSSYTYQWNRNGTAISGATAQTYTAVSADLGKVITVAVTATATNYAPTTVVSYASTINNTGATHDPTTVTGLVARYRAENVTGVSDGTAFTTWPDSSGSGYNATALNAAASPVYIASSVNGRPGIRFAATTGQTYAGKMLSSSLPSNQAAQTIVAVVQMPVVNGTARTIRSSPANGGLAFRVNGTGKLELVQRGTASIGTDTATVPTTPVVLTARYTVSGGAWAFFINGVAGASGSNSVSLTSTSTIGGDTNFGEPFVGDMLDQLYYGKALTAAELAVVHSYVQDQYGIVVTDYTP